MQPAVLSCLICFLFCASNTHAQNARQVLPYRIGNKYGFADKLTGKVLLEPSYDSVGVTPEFPFIWAKRGNKYELLHHSMKSVLPMGQDEPYRIWKMPNGMCIVYKPIHVVFEGEDADYASAEYDGPIKIAVTYLSAEGNVFGQIFQDTILSQYFNQPIDVEFEAKNQLITLYKAGKYAIFDLESGKLITKYAYDAIVLFNGVALASETGPVQPGVETVFNKLVDTKSGKEYPLPADMFCSVPSPRRPPFIVHDKLNTKFALINGQGKVITKKDYRQIIFNGKYIAQDNENNWVILNNEGSPERTLGNGSYLGFDANQNIWISSATDSLFRQVSPEPKHRIGKIGVTSIPNILQGGGFTFYTTRERKDIYNISDFYALRDTNGNRLLSDKYYHFSLDSAQVNCGTEERKYSFFLKAVAVFNPSDLIDPVTMKVIQSPQAKYELLQPLIGDSVYIVFISQQSRGVQNIRTGELWKWTGSNISKYNTQDNGTFSTVEIGFKKFLDCNGQELVPPKLFSKIMDWSAQKPRFFGAWLPDSYTFLLTDTLGNELVQFKGMRKYYQHQVELIQNAGSLKYPELLAFGYHTLKPDSLLDATQQAMAYMDIKDTLDLYSLKGELLAERLAYKNAVSNDNVIVENVQQQMSAFNLISKKTIIPFGMDRLGIREDKIYALSANNTASVYTLEGKHIGKYPDGFAPFGAWSEGFQVTRNKQCDYLLINDKLQKAEIIKGDCKAIQGFSEGIAAIRKDKNWQFIDKSGKIVIEEEFNSVGQFRDGRAIVEKLDGTNQLIDRENTVFLFSKPNSQSYMGSIQWKVSGLYSIMDSTGFTYYDKNGKQLKRGCFCVTNNQTQALNQEQFYSGDSLYVAQSGTISPLGPVKWVKAPTPAGDILYKYAMSDYCGAGLRDSTDKKWLIQPRPYQSIQSDQDMHPYARVRIDNPFINDATQSKKIVHKFTGVETADDFGYFIRIDDHFVGYNDDEKTAWEYISDFQSTKPFDYRKVFLKIHADYNPNTDASYIENPESIGSQGFDYFTKDGIPLFKD
jgi:hypothetical protein